MKRDMNQNTMSGQKADIIIDKLAIGKINGMIYRDPMHECGGILLGNISQDVVTGKYTAHVCDLYEEERIGTSSTFEFTTDYLMNAVKYVKRTVRICISSETSIPMLSIRHFGQGLIMR